MGWRHADPRVARQRLGVGDETKVSPTDQEKREDPQHRETWCRGSSVGIDGIDQGRGSARMPMGRTRSLVGPTKVAPDSPGPGKSSFDFHL